MEQKFNNLNFITMKKDKEKATYESPQTTRTTVSLESGICSASADVQNPSDANGQIERHEVNTDFDFSFGGQDWENSNNVDNN